MFLKYEFSTNGDFIGICMSFFIIGFRIQRYRKTNVRVCIQNRVNIRVIKIHAYFESVKSTFKI